MGKMSFELGFNLVICAFMIPAYGAGAAGLKTIWLKDTRIVNGADATLNQSRHQVSIRLRSLEYYFGHGHICGGSVISKNVVLSAAHCFVYTGTEIALPEENFIAVMGTLDRLNYTETTLIATIMKIITHENFKFATLDNDIALVVLNDKVPTGHSAVKEIFLNEGPIKSNTLCQVTGWGYSEVPKLSRQLKIADQPIIDRDDCIEKYVHGSWVLEGMMCAGYLEDETKVHMGDSGGPLVCNGIQVGVVSFRFRETFGPGIYTDVAYYKQWISKELAKCNCALPEFDSISANNSMN